MQTDVSTNLRLPLEDWKAIKVKAAQEGKSMKELILEGIRFVLGREKQDSPAPSSSLLMEFAGKAKVSIKDGSTNHDDYLK